MKRHRFPLVLLLAALALSFIGCQVSEPPLTGKVMVSVDIKGYEGYEKVVVWGKDSSGNASSGKLELEPGIKAGELVLPAGDWTIEASVMKGADVLASASTAVKVVPDATVNALISITEESSQPVLNLEAPKYTVGYSRSIIINCKEHVEDEIKFNFLIDGEVFDQAALKYAGEPYVYMHTNRLEDGEHVLSGTAEINGETFALPTMEFIVSSSVSCFIDSEYPVYENGKVTHQFHRYFRIGDLQDFDNCSCITEITDSFGFSESIEWVTDDYEFVYEGNDLGLSTRTEVRNPDGLLLLCAVDDFPNFSVDFNGSATVVIPESGTVETTYGVAFSRNDVEIKAIYELDGETVDLANPIVWTSDDLGEHSLEVYYEFNDEIGFVDWFDILVVEEKIDDAIVFNSTPIWRDNDEGNEFRFDLESSEILSSDNLAITASMDGIDVSEYIYTYKRNEGYVSVYLDIPAEIPMGSRIMVEAGLLNDNYSIIQKTSQEFEIQELHLYSHSSYRLGICHYLYAELIGALPGETFSYYIDDVELDENGSDIWIEDNNVEIRLEDYGYGQHTLVAVSDSDHERRSEKLVWYTGTVLDIDSPWLYGNPSATGEYRLELLKDPADELPELVEYSLWYQYPGLEKVTLPSNDTGVFTVPTDVMDGVSVSIGYSAVCGGNEYGYESSYYISNCILEGVPSEIKKGSTDPCTMSLMWYNDLLTYENYDYEWIIDGEVVGTEPTLTTVLPTDSPDFNITFKMKLRTEPLTLVWESIIVHVVE